MNNLLKHINKSRFKGLALLLSLIILMCPTAFGQISIPGTGRVALSQEEPYWHVYGQWNTIPGSLGEIHTEPYRTGVNEQYCVQNNDHTISASASKPSEGGPHYGPGTVYFVYEFYVIQDGTYSTNNFYVSGADGPIEIIKRVSGQAPQVMASQNSSHAPCEAYSFTVTLTAGVYELRIESFINDGVPAVIFVNSAGGGGSNCVPSVHMTGTTTSYSYNSGATTNIPLSASVSSNFSWTVSANSNVTGMSSGTGTPIAQTLTNHTSQPQTITYTVTPTSATGNCIGLPQTITVTVNPACINGCDPIECKDCIGSFAPDKNQTYVISAWVQQANSAQEMNYPSAALGINFTGGGTSEIFHTSGTIIDGWQRIEGTFTVPDAASEVFVKLINTGTNEVYFDDLRIHPLKASLKSFVYDPVSMRLMAELDENNYATFYEYDEEGALIRVKKETERGVKTIKETGNNTRKKP